MKIKIVCEFTNFEKFLEFFKTVQFIQIELSDYSVPIIFALHNTQLVVLYHCYWEDCCIDQIGNLNVNTVNGKIITEIELEEKPTSIEREVKEFIEKILNLTKDYRECIISTTRVDK